MRVTARYIDGQWVSPGGTALNLPSRFHEIVESGQAPFGRVIGGTLTATQDKAIAQAETTNPDVVYTGQMSKPAPKTTFKPSLPKNFVGRLVIPEDIRASFNANPNAFSTVEKADGKFVVEPKEASPVEESEGEEYTDDDSPVQNFKKGDKKVSFAQMTEMALDDAKHRNRTHTERWRKD